MGSILESTTTTRRNTSGQKMEVMKMMNEIARKLVAAAGTTEQTIHTTNEGLLKEIIEICGEENVEITTTDDGTYEIEIFDAPIRQELYGTYDEDRGYTIELCTDYLNGSTTYEELFTYKRESTARKKALELGIEWNGHFYAEGEA